MAGSSAPHHEDQEEEGEHQVHFVLPPAPRTYERPRRSQVKAPLHNGWRLTRFVSSRAPPYQHPGLHQHVPKGMGHDAAHLPPRSLDPVVPPYTDTTQH